MNRKMTAAFLAVAFAIPAIGQPVRAADNKASKAEERHESPQRQQKEEQKALDKYTKACAAHGKDSPQAKKAWDRYAAEMKEHGHESQIQQPS